MNTELHDATLGDEPCGCFACDNGRWSWIDTRPFRPKNEAQKVEVVPITGIRSSGVTQAQELYLALEQVFAVPSYPALQQGMASIEKWREWFWGDNEVFSGPQVYRTAPSEDLTIYKIITETSKRVIQVLLHNDELVWVAVHFGSGSIRAAGEVLARLNGYYWIATDNGIASVRKVDAFLRHKELGRSTWDKTWCERHLDYTAAILAATAEDEINAQSLYDLCNEGMIDGSDLEYAFVWLFGGATAPSGSQRVSRRKVARLARRWIDNSLGRFLAYAALHAPPRPPYITVHIQAFYELQASCELLSYSEFMQLLAKIENEPKLDPRQKVSLDYIKALRDQESNSAIKEFLDIFLVSYC